MLRTDVPVNSILNLHSIILDGEAWDGEFKIELKTA